MDNAVMAYLADKILQDLRNGVQLDEALCASITRFSNFDVLRGAVRPDDVDILIRLAALPQTNLAALALGLLQPLESDPRVSAFLRSAWQEAESFYRKWTLTVRLLDDATLEPVLKEGLYQFVFTNIARVHERATTWFGGTEGVLEGCRRRLADPKYPSSKAWLYLVCAVASDDKSAVAKLLQDYATQGDEFARRAARELLNGPDFAKQN